LAKTKGEKDATDSRNPTDVRNRYPHRCRFGRTCNGEQDRTEPNFFSKGQPLIQPSSICNSAYLVVHGEVLIVRHGRPVDLVEAGELLEADLWPDAMAIALTPGILEMMESPDPRVQTLLTAMKIS